MALERKNRVKETTTTTGTGAISLSGTAPAGYRIFNVAITDGATVRYFIESENLSEWEVGEGVFTAGTPDTVSRDTVYASSNSDALVNFSAGTKTMAVSLVAEDILGGQNSIIRNETPSGDLDGVDVTYTLANTPITGSLALYLNGQRLTYTEDYTLSGNTITFVTAPVSTDLIRADYLLAGEGSGNADTLDGYQASEFDLSTDLTKYSNFNAPEGFLINGKIVPSVASNNLTVAIKGLDGNDPSATNPVYCRIGDTVRSITSALSVTKNAGINWFNAGSAELATKEIDYFVYLGYNATDGVVIGFSRIPFANQYDDFSTTTTNEKYCAISTITNASATDYYEVVGRFSATLSAGAGYTWSVPTFTANNLIQRPIYETRKLLYTPTLAVSGGTAPTYTATFTNFYKILGSNLKTWHTWGNSSGGTAGAGTGLLTGSMPISVLSDGNAIGSGVTLNATAGKMFIVSSQSDVVYFNSNFDNLTGNSQNGTTRYIYYFTDALIS